MKKIRKAVFPVAGLGTRFLPATKASPKEMLPLVDKPMIQYVVEEAIASGIEEIILITGRGKNAIEDHFDNAIELEQLLKEKNKLEELKMIKDISDMCDFVYIRQKEPLGLGHAILRAKNAIGPEPFAVLLGDDIIYSDGVPALKQLITVYEETGSSVIAVEKIPRSKISSYGVVDTEWEKDDSCKIRGLVEKPAEDKAPSELAVIGRYILTPKIFELLENVERDKSGEIQLTAGLNELCALEDMYGCKFSGKRYDAGNKLGFLMATVEYGLRRKEFGDEFRNYIKALNL